MRGNIGTDWRVPARGNGGGRESADELSSISSIRNVRTFGLKPDVHPLNPVLGTEAFPPKAGKLPRFKLPPVPSVPTVHQDRALQGSDMRP